MGLEYNAERTMGMVVPSSSMTQRVFGVYSSHESIAGISSQNNRNGELDAENEIHQRRERARLYFELDWAYQGSFRFVCISDDWQVLPSYGFKPLGWKEVFTNEVGVLARCLSCCYGIS